MLVRGDSLLVKHSVPPNKGGSIPTSPLQVKECKVAFIQEVIERIHYSKTIFGVTTSYCYAVMEGDLVVGGAIFGLPAAFNVSCKYDQGEPLLELRRFVLEDRLPRNSESKMLAVMLRDLKKKGIKRILSYADPAFGHTGIIYAATGFRQMGKTTSRNHVLWKGKRYPDRNIHQVNFPFHKEIRKAIENGEATKVRVSGKIIWLRKL